MNPFALTVRVQRKHVEAVDVCSFELVNVDGTPLPSFSAGSHIDVALPNGTSRQYSLCNDPSECHRYLIGVLKDPSTRGGSYRLVLGHQDHLARTGEPDLEAAVAVGIDWRSEAPLAMKKTLSQQRRAPAGAAVRRA